MTRKERIKIRKIRIDARNERMRLRDLKKQEKQDTIPQIIEREKQEPILQEPGKINLDVCIHTFHYAKRLTWMLSSILCQQGNIPNIQVCISYTDDDGCPTTKDVIDFFRKEGLNIKETKMTKENIPNRSCGRNAQVQETKADWMLFADSDMVYSPYFFEDIQQQLLGQFKDETKCIGADRISLSPEFCIKYFNEDQEPYPRLIKNTEEIVSKWPVKRVAGRGTAPGNFQLASVKSIMASGGVYVPKRDFWRNTISDRAFRIRLGGRTPMIVKKQYHLNHDRLGPELQR